MQINSGSIKALPPGNYFCIPAVTDLPSAGYYYVSVRLPAAEATNDKIIIAISAYGTLIYILTQTNGTYNKWHSIMPEQVP